MNPYIELPRFGRQLPGNDIDVRRIERDALDLVLSSAAYRWVTRIEMALQSLAALLRRARRRRRAIHQLSALPDRMLQDIGLDRGAIPRVVDGVLAREETDERR